MPNGRCCRTRSTTGLQDNGGVPVRYPFSRWLCKELQPKFVMTFPPRLPQMHHACFHYLLRLEGYVELLHMHDKRCPQHARQSKLGLERSHKILEMATLVPVRERERERERDRAPQRATPPHPPRTAQRHHRTRPSAAPGTTRHATQPGKANHRLPRGNPRPTTKASQVAKQLNQRAGPHNRL